MRRCVKLSQCILVPTDGSNSSIRALEYAIELVKKTAGKITLLNVQPNFSTPHAKILFSKKDVEEYTQMIAAEALETAKKLVDEAGVPFCVKVRVGIPKVEICDEAKESKANLIVMGYRGLGAISRTMLGSVSYGVLHETPCPVTIIP